MTHCRKIIEINPHLVDCAISELLQAVGVLVLRLFSTIPLLTAALCGIVIIVHEVVLVAQIAFVNGDVPHSSCDGLLG